MISFKDFLLEYYTKPLSDLIKHLNANRLSDREFWLYLGREYADYHKGEDDEYLFHTFFYESGFDWTKILEGEELKRYIELKSIIDSDGDDIDDAQEELDDLVTTKAGDYFTDMEGKRFSEVPETIIVEYGEWISKYALFEYSRNINRPKMEKYINLGDYPPCYFMGYEGYLKNDWLIHFSEESNSIASEGFLYGMKVGDMKGLALSTWKSLEDKDLIDMDGYIFSYSLDRFQHTNLFQVGTDFVIFQGSGILTYHHGDNEYQVICMKDSVRNFIPVLYSGGDTGYEIQDKDSGTVYWKSDKKDIGEVMEELNDWINNNIRQYGRRIITRVKR